MVGAVGIEPTTAPQMFSRGPYIKDDQLIPTWLTGLSTEL
jgi:hypothetical protein